MARKRALLEKMSANPSGNWTMADLERLCRQIGLQCHAPSHGSHYVVASDAFAGMLTVPARRPIKTGLHPPARRPRERAPEGQEKLMNDYAILILPHDEADGGGYLGIVPDLPGCMSDGETRDEALKNTAAALAEWLSAARAAGRDIPPPGRAAERAKDREKALIETIRVLSERSDPRNERIEALSNQIDRLRELIERQDAWPRLDRLISHAA